MPKFNKLLSTNGLKWDRNFYPHFVSFAFCVLRGQASHTRRSANGAQPNFVKRKEVNGAYASQIKWHRIVNVNATIEIGSLVSGAPKHFKL